MLISQQKRTIWTKALKDPATRSNGGARAYPVADSEAGAYGSQVEWPCGAWATSSAPVDAGLELATRMKNEDGHGVYYFYAKGHDAKNTTPAKVTNQANSCTLSEEGYLLREDMRPSLFSSCKRITAFDVEQGVVVKFKLSFLMKHMT